MLDSILVNSSGQAELTVVSALICSVVSLLIGAVISFVYMKCSRKYTKDYVITLVILPILVQTVIMIVNGNLGVGVAVMGAFSLVRFRSIPGSAKEIGIIFFAMAAGLATGMGYVVYGAGITIIVSAVFLIMSTTNFGMPRMQAKKLKITIPEDLDYTGAFEDLFEKYTTVAELDAVKTTNLGSLFTITYDICLKSGVNEKEFIDDIRCRNGNLTVILAREHNELSL